MYNKENRTCKNSLNGLPNANKMTARSNRTLSNNRMKFCAYSDTLIGFSVIVLQTFVYDLKDDDLIVCISIGFWGGLFFVATGFVIHKQKNRKTVRNIAINSLLTSLLIIVIFSYDLTTYDSSNPNVSEMAIGIAFVVCGSLALVTNCVVIHKTNNMIRATRTSAMNVNISEPSQRIYAISLSSEGNGVFFSNHGNAYTNDDEPPPPYYQLIEISSPPDYSTVNYNDDVMNL